MSEGFHFSIKTLSKLYNILFIPSGIKTDDKSNSLTGLRSNDAPGAQVNNWGSDNKITNALATQDRNYNLLLITRGVATRK